MRNVAHVRVAAVVGVLAVLGACTGTEEQRPGPTPTATAAPATPPVAVEPSPTVATSTPRVRRPAAVGETGRSPVPDVDAAAPGPLAVHVLEDRGGERLRFAPAWAPAITAGGLTLRLARAERTASAPHPSQAERADAGFRAQLAYRQLAATPAWQAEVLEALPPDLRRVAEGNLAARTALDRLRTEGEERRGGAPTTLPAWSIVPPAPADELRQHYEDAADAIGVEWEYLAAINLVETRMGRIRGTSTAGARGPMQFIPTSWDLFGQGDIEDERDSIFAAARHLRQRGWDVSPREALYRYNTSEHYVDAVEAYAEVLAAHPDAYDTYHGWQVFYTTDRATFLLPVGYDEAEPVPVADYLARPVVEVRG